MAGKGKNFGRQHKKLLQRPQASVAPPEPQVTLEELQSKRNIPKNQALIDLDHAEDLTLKLLDICASTTDQFALMAGGDTGGEDDEGRGVVDKKNETDKKNDGSISDGKSSSMSISSSTSNDEQRRISKIQRNGSEFRDKLKKIHDLLSPHAHLVVNYSNEHGGKDTSAKARYSSVNSVGIPETTGATDEHKKKEDENPKNMYASRLEMRLAIERRNLLRDMLKLEKERRRQSIPMNRDEATANPGIHPKRKRED